MVQEHIPLKEAIHTADAENPRLVFANGEMIFRYTDWRAIERKITFFDVVGFKWQDEIEIGFSERDDMPYQVKNSKWIEELKNLNVIDSNDDYKHYKLCFNACGMLDVVFTELEIEP